MAEREPPRRSTTDAIVEDAVNDLTDGLDVGRPGSERRREFLTDTRWLTEQRKRLDARKEQKRTVWVGVLSSILVTIATTILTYATGLLQWLLNFSTVHR